MNLTLTLFKGNTPKEWHLLQDPLLKVTPPLTGYNEEKLLEHKPLGVTLKL